MISVRAAGSKTQRQLHRGMQALTPREGSHYSRLQKYVTAVYNLCEYIVAFFSFFLFFWGEGGAGFCSCFVLFSFCSCLFLFFVVVVVFVLSVCLVLFVNCFL